MCSKAVTTGGINATTGKFSNLGSGRPSGFSEDWRSGEMEKMVWVKSTNP